jgi:PadR family transcriptional regulator PadR
VLQALADGHRYGFDVIDHTGLPSGTVYPALATLTRKGLARSRWEDEALAREEGRPRRRYYEVTREGEAELEAALRRFGSIGLRPLGETDPEAAG